MTDRKRKKYFNVAKYLISHFKKYQRPHFNGKTLQFHKLTYYALCFSDVNLLSTCFCAVLYMPEDSFKHT